MLQGLCLRLLPDNYTVCQVEDPSLVDFSQPCFFARTQDECSLVCPTEKVPDTLRRADGWRGFYIKGELDFSLVGILAGISGILAAEKISIFAVSTYNTDYVFIPEAHWQRALNALAKAGYRIDEVNAQ